MTFRFSHYTLVGLMAVVGSGVLCTRRLVDGIAKKARKNGALSDLVEEAAKAGKF